MKKKFSAKDLKEIVRLSERGISLMGDWIDPHEAYSNDIYEITIDDLESALGLINEGDVTTGNLVYWIGLIVYTFHESIVPDLYDFSSEVPFYEYPDTEREIVRRALLMLKRDEDEAEEADLPRPAALNEGVKQATEYLAFCKANKDLPEEQRKYPASMEEHLIIAVQREQIPELSEELGKRYLDAVERLAEKDNILALNTRCYTKYSGDQFYEQDFYGAKKDAERLLELTGDGMYANTLGYIYYYGRCNDGKPQYEEAYKCFTYGAANGVYESVYKLADMYEKGYGVKKSESTAYRLVSMLYDHLIRIYDGNGNGDELADAALRLGSMYLHGTGVSEDPQTAMSVLLRARCVAKRRMEYTDFFGNPSVLANIESRLKEAGEFFDKERNNGWISFPEWNVVSALMGGTYTLHWEAVRHKNNRYTITFERVPFRNEDQAQKTFLVSVGHRYCEYSERIKGTFTLKEGEIPDQGFANGLFTEAAEKGTVHVMLTLFDNEMAEFTASAFKWKVEKEKEEEKQDDTYILVRVCFEPHGRVYDYLSARDDYKPGDKVMVEGKDGPAEATVVSVKLAKEEDLILPASRYKRIL